MTQKIINTIKINLMYKKKLIKLKLNKYELNIIKALMKINLIKLVKKNNNHYFIYLNYFEDEPLFKNIVNLNKSSKPIFITYNMLKYITYKYNIIIILNTNKGVLTNFEALNYKLGGVLILKL